jgi:DNA-binding phage protein
MIRIEVNRMSNSDSVYWDDLAEDLKDPEFLRQFILESIRINTIDTIVNQLDEARELAGLSKADLARSISAEPAVVRRMLGHASRSNPTLGTLSELAAALGYRVALVPVEKTGRSVAEALRTGVTADPKALSKAAEELAS